MPEDTPGEEQPTMLSFTEAADRLVTDGIAQSMTAEGLRKLARDPASGWPIGPDDYRVVGKTRMLPYELLVPYMQARRRGRGPDKTKQRSAAPQRQGAAMPQTTEQPVIKPDYLTDEQWAAFVYSVLYGVGDGLRKAGLEIEWAGELGALAVDGLRARLDELMAQASDG